MSEGFNYFSHQSLTPNYISGTKGEYENISAVTTSAACTAVIEASNNIMFTGNMAQVDWSATNEVARKDMTWKTGVTISDLHYFNAEYTTLNLQSGVSAMRPLLFDAAYGSNVNAMGGVDMTNINFTGSGNGTVSTTLGDEVSTKPYTFQGTGYETFMKHAGEMTIQDANPGVQDPAMGDVVDGFGTFHCGKEGYDHMSHSYTNHRFSHSGSYRAISHGGQSPEYVDIRNCTTKMINASRTMSNSNGAPASLLTTNGSYYYLSFLMADDSNHPMFMKIGGDKLMSRNCVIAGYTDAASNHNEPGPSWQNAKSITSGFQFLEMESSVGSVNTNHDGGGLGSIGDDSLIVACSVEVQSGDAAGDAVYIHSNANDNVAYGLNIHSNNTSYGNVLDQPGDGTITGNESTT